MPRRTPREDRKAEHRKPGRGMSARSKLARAVGNLEDGSASDVVRFTSGHQRDDLAPRQRAPMTDRVVCSNGKLGFSKAVAQAKLEEYRAQVNHRGAKPTRIYECPKCSTPAKSWWHLTSQALRPPRREAS